MQKVCKLNISEHAVQAHTDQKTVSHRVRREFF
jgi:hypothetical protein